jgi:hypothetical protein
MFSTILTLYYLYLLLPTLHGRLSNNNFRKIVYWNSHDFQHSNGKHYKISVALPQDMSAIWKVAGLGGVCSSTEWLCSYCCCRSGMRGIAALFKCADCERDYAPEHVCKHHSFIEGSEHRATDVLQDVRDSEIEVRTSGWALDGLCKTAHNHLKAVKKDMLEAISTCSTSHPGSLRPLCTSLPTLL